MAKIKIMALGGLGENGKNMYVVEVDEKLFILDAGIRYPDVDLYGVDQVIPDISYLVDHKDQIEGIFISHGHEDNMGAVPYLLKNLQTRVYGSHFTISIIESILKEYDMNIEDYKLFRINANKIMKFGDVNVKFFNTTHSIPESMGISIITKDGSIVYATDFNFGASSDGTYKTTFDKIAELGNSKVIAILSESISSGNIGRIDNDSLLEHHFKKILLENHDRIIVGAFSTDLIRIQKIIDLAVEAGRKIAIVGKHTERIIGVAASSGYLRIPEELVFHISAYTKEELSNLKNVVIIVTGYRHEPYKSLVKMCLKSDERMDLTPNDKVVLICPPVAGTEQECINYINELYKQDINLSIFDKDVLRSQHASPEDLKMIYAMVKPKYIIPIKGEYHNMYEQKLVAKEVGYTDEQILLLDNGEQITFENGELLEEHLKYNIKDVFIDGSNIGVVDDDVVKERSTLAEEGIIFLYANIDTKKHQMIGSVKLSSKGFTSNMTEDALTNALGGLMERIINNSLKKNDNVSTITEKLTDELAKTVFRYTKHNPVIVPIIYQI